MSLPEVILWDGVTIKNWSLFATGEGRRHTFCVMGEAVNATKRGIQTSNVAEVFQRDDGSTFIRTRSGSVYRLGRAHPALYSVLTPSRRVSPNAAWWILQTLLGPAGELKLDRAVRKRRM